MVEPLLADVRVDFFAVEFLVAMLRPYPDFAAPHLTPPPRRPRRANPRDPTVVVRHLGTPAGRRPENTKFSSCGVGVLRRNVERDDPLSQGAHDEHHPAGRLIGCCRRSGEGPPAHRRSGPQGRVAERPGRRPGPPPASSVVPPLDGAGSGRLTRRLRHLIPRRFDRRPLHSDAKVSGRLPVRSIKTTLRSVR